MMKMNLDTPIAQSAVSVVKRLQESGHQAYFVGGCVRDGFLGGIVKDIDIATSAHPEEVVKIFSSAKLVGAKFGVVIVSSGEFSFEVATFRKDGVYSDGRRPDSVSFGSIEDDAGRRDFTMNAIFFDPVSGDVKDFHRGVNDLRAGVIQTVGEPEKRFEEDYLRMLRAVRFGSKYSKFIIHARTFGAIVRNAHKITEISQERIASELIGMFTTRYPNGALKVLHQTGLLKHILPEVEAMIGVEQPPDHHPEGDVFQHTLRVMYFSPRTPVMAMAALLHDVGKPKTQDTSTGRIRFPGHEHVGADMARAILNRLRFSGDFIDSVVHLVDTHMMFLQIEKLRKSKLRTLLGHPMIEEMMALHKADCRGSNNDFSHLEFAKAKLEEFASTQEPVLPEALVDGRDLIAFGLTPGPVFKKILNAVREAQLEGEVTSRQEACEFAKGLSQAPAFFAFDTKN